MIEFNITPSKVTTIEQINVNNIVNSVIMDVIPGSPEDDEKDDWKYEYNISGDDVAFIFLNDTGSRHVIEIADTLRHWAELHIRDYDHDHGRKVLIMWPKNNYYYSYDNGILSIGVDTDEEFIVSRS